MAKRRSYKTSQSISTDKLCEYGCNQQAKFITGQGKHICSSSANSCPENKKKNADRGKLAYSSGKRISGIEQYKNLPPDSKDRMNWADGKFVNTIFEYGGSGNHKALLIQERGHQCEECGNESWGTVPIPLELEHIDGDNKNNVKENLKLLCCNCHALTPTWRGRNINNGKQKVSDADLLLALKTFPSIRQALSSVGLTPKGGNYDRAYNLLGTVV